MTNRIVTEVGICQAFDHQSPPTPPFPMHTTLALWDTGATQSVITRATALSLGLVPVGTSQVHHAGGISNSSTYMINFVLPNKVGISGVMVSECHDIPGNIGAIIGMDIICTGDFSITNIGKKTCMSFRVPSIETIDYVEEANNIKPFMGGKTGRNAPCSCGSGKKYKRCHGR